MSLKVALICFGSEAPPVEHTLVAADPSFAGNARDDTTGLSIAPWCWNGRSYSHVASDVENASTLPGGAWFTFNETEG
ncbi:hypothetical protein [Aliiruegeria haliotis]|uniref:hypothetical protein n=1 Tax=Aliiruegeria haliotis TaxID=1280846 RepID=UPI0011B2101B|nr:hypothetical protein [Aliiruegeria haliotis]